MVSGDRLYAEDKLIECIERNYGYRDAWNVPVEAGEFIKDMFRVLRVFPGGLSVICEEEHFDVWVFERDVLEHVNLGNIFSMTIFRFDDEWRLWHMSAPCCS
jgi:hypothetical protein